MSALKSPRPTPKFFCEPETFSTKKARATPKDQVPPRPPIKSAPPISRIFNKPIFQKAQAISFKDSDTSLYNKLYNEDTKELYFEKCFDVCLKLGAGSFGEVFKVRSKEDGKYYAIKRSRERFRGKSDKQIKLEEVRKHEELPKHINCIQFIKAWEEKQHLYIQSELCSASLSNYAEQNHDIPETLIWKYLVDLLMAVKHLHDHDLLHLDIKPDNIFITSDGICKLGDFGLVLDLRKRDLSGAQEGDPKYLAPELLEGHFTKAADIFSLGITILELASDLDLPRGGEGWQQLRHGSIPNEICSKLSSSLKNVIHFMMNPDYKRRPTAFEILSLIDVKKVLKRRQIELRFKTMVSSVKIAFLWIYVFLILTFKIILHPISWITNKIKIRENINLTSTPTINLSSSKNAPRPIWDPSFSDDEVFDDDLNCSHNSSLGAIPLSEMSTSGESKNGSFFIPSLPSRLMNSTPAQVKHRQTTKRLFVPPGLDSFRISPNLSISPCIQQNISFSGLNNSSFKETTLDSKDLLRTSIGPRNLMQVFNNADSDGGI